MYSEGEKTEINYLQGYLSDKYSGNLSVKFVDIQDIRENTAKSLVDRVVKEKKSRDKKLNDIYWIAYDRESEAEYKEKLHHEAFKKAKDHDINIALSNICIEQWILLHYVKSTAQYTSFKNLMDNSCLKEKLREQGVQDYDKGDIGLYEMLKDKLDIARKNAIKVNSETKELSNENAKPFQLNPYTDFHLVLDAIDKFLTKE
ncbi:RloB family protein [Vibrio fluvialis]|nr:RloB family protein [Vibrio fluvialis]